MNYQLLQGLLIPHIIIRPSLPSVFLYRGEIYTLLNQKFDNMDILNNELICKVIAIGNIDQEHTYPIGESPTAYYIKIRYAVIPYSVIPPTPQEILPVKIEVSNPITSLLLTD